MDVPEERVFRFRYAGSGYNISVKSVFFQLYLGPVFSTRKCRFPVDNNMIDMRVTNNTVKWQQHVSALYPKRLLQAEGKWLLRRPRTNGLKILNFE